MVAAGHSPRLPIQHAIAVTSPTLEYGSLVDANLLEDLKACPALCGTVLPVGGVIQRGEKILNIMPVYTTV